jgi:hypothetical protein
VYYALVSFYSTDPVVLSSNKPPQGFTGATGNYCTSCHGGFERNSVGGGVLVTGLPVNNYTAGQKYNFSIAISHKDANRTRWGFSIIAVNNVGTMVGTFSSTNSNAALNGIELSHKSAVFAGPQNSYTYSDLAWTAPALPGIHDATIKFYVAAIAANGGGSNIGDYVYSDFSQAKFGIIYTFTGSGNWSSAANWSGGTVPPDTIKGSDAEIVINPFEGSECILNKVQVITGGSKLTVSSGARVTIPGSLTIQ